MVDADQVGISKSGIDPNVARTPQPQEAEPEARILEERVTRPAEKPAALPPIPKPATPPPISQPSAVPDATGDAGPLPPRDKPILKTPPAPQNIAPQNAGNRVAGDDMAKILAEVKLPERRVPADPGEQHPASEAKKFDTSIVGAVLSGSESVASPTVAGSTPESADTRQAPATIAPPPQGVRQGGPTSPGPSEPKKAEEVRGSVTAVHTLKHDLQAVVQEEKMSLVRAASLEADRKARQAATQTETPAARQRSKRTVGIVFASFILLALGGAALFGVSVIMNQQKAPTQPDAGSSILFAEQSVLLSLDNQSSSDLKRVLEAARTTSQGTLGSITQIVPIATMPTADGATQDRPATFGEFMAAIGAHPPDDLLRALQDDFFLGLHVVDKSAPILIIPVISHDRAFQAMLSWEKTLNADLAPMVTPVPALTQDENGLPVQRTYQDLIMRNYDVRALKDDSGTIQLYYSFPTQNMLVIAESPYSFSEILSRLQAGRKL